MSTESLKHANYHIPSMHELSNERCRDCAEKERANLYGESIRCRWHGIFVRHSHHCDNFHRQGTLL